MYQDRTEEAAKKRYLALGERGPTTTLCAHLYCIAHCTPFYILQKRLNSVAVRNPSYVRGGVQIRTATTQGTKGTNGDKQILHTY